jgi:acetyl-CoA/propionyl-CoA carboxylase biotin carboxyl carrier protein
VDPWDIADGWRLTGPAEQSTQWQLSGQVIDAAVGDGTVRIGDAPASAARAHLAGIDLVIETDRASARYGWAGGGDTVWLGRHGDAWQLTRLRDTIDRTGPAGTGAGPLTSPMPGTVLAVHVKPGQHVSAGQPLVTVEAMKMEHAVVATVDGTVGEVLVTAGESVRLDQPLVVVAESSAAP